MRVERIALAERWDEYWSEVGNEQWLAARELIELSPRVRGLFASFVTSAHDSHHGEGMWLDWDAAAARVEVDGLSSTEYRLARMAVALTATDPESRVIDLESLSCMGSWSADVWRVLVQFGTDGRLTTAAGTGETPARRAAAALGMSR